MSERWEELEIEVEFLRADVLRQETAELERALECGDDIVQEVADFAMMIADKARSPR